MPLKFVITGTDTDVGKTVFSSALVNAFNAYYWKPIQCGQYPQTDSEVVAELSGVSSNKIITEKYKFQLPASPHLASHIENIVIHKHKIQLPAVNAPLIIEGAGGLLVPLTDSCLLIEIFFQWQIPVILCARTTIGTINHTLLSLEILRKYNIPVFGIVFIGAKHVETEKIIRQLGRVRILGCLPFIYPLNQKNLQDAFQKYFDFSLFQKEL